MWTKKDLNWLEKYHPNLVETKPGTIEGIVSFRLLRSDEKYIINPSESAIKDNSSPDYLYIEDSYSVKVVWPEGKNIKYPTVHETGNRLELIAKKLGKEAKDLHQFSNRSLCLASPMKLWRTFSTEFLLKTYIEDFLIPFLFAQSYYAEKQEWLWGDLEHGYKGLLQWLGGQNKYDDTDLHGTYLYLNSLSDEEKNTAMELLKTRPRGHHLCTCGSEKKTRDCHPEIQEGIIRLRGAISRGIITIT
jgi:hypothetical protein